MYKRLDIKVKEFGESYYNPMIPGVIEMLTKKGLVEESQGQLIRLLRCHGWWLGSMSPTRC